MKTTRAHIDVEHLNHLKIAFRFIDYNDIMIMNNRFFDFWKFSQKKDR